MANHDEQEREQAPLSGSQGLLPPELHDPFHDPLRDTEKELGGFDEFSLTEAESSENASYLASVSALGNQMMLDIMKGRLSTGQKPRGGDPGEFAAVTDLIDAITSGFDNKVNRENFSTSYGNMLIKYSQLIKACHLYTDSRNGKKHFFKGARQTESDRLEQVSQVAQIAHREMSVIRSMSGRMAISKNGLTWRELFGSSGKLENAKSTYAKLHPDQDQGLTLSDQIKSGTKLRHVETRESSKPSAKTSGGTEFLLAKISRMSSKLERLELRYENMQRTLDELTRAQKSGEKLEELGNPNENEPGMESQGEPVYIFEDESERHKSKIPRMQETGALEEH